MDELNKIKKAYRNGASINKIAIQYSRSWETIKKAVDASSEELENRGRRPNKKSKVVAAEVESANDGYLTKEVYGRVKAKAASGAENVNAGVALNNKLSQLEMFQTNFSKTYKEELESGKLIAEHQEAYDDFFVIKITPKHGTQVSYNTQAVSQYINRYSGFQALLTNSIKDPIEAVQIYRDKDSREML